MRRACSTKGRPWCVYGPCCWHRCRQAGGAAVGKLGAHAAGPPGTLETSSRCTQHANSGRQDHHAQVSRAAPSKPQENSLEAVKGRGHALALQGGPGHQARGSGGAAGGLGLRGRRGRPAPNPFEGGSTRGTNSGAGLVTKHCAGLRALFPADCLAPTAAAWRTDTPVKEEARQLAAMVAMRACARQAAPQWLQQRVCEAQQGPRYSAAGVFGPVRREPGQSWANAQGGAASVPGLTLAGSWTARA